MFYGLTLRVIIGLCRFRIKRECRLIEGAFETILYATFIFDNFYMKGGGGFC